LQSSPRMNIDPRSTALILIDLQRGIVSRDTTPHPASQIVERAVRLAARFREVRATVVLVRVAFSADDQDRLKLRADQPAPPASSITPDFSMIVPELGPRDGDIVIIKRQWGAFYGTELDLQLRRRSIRTIVLAGIATNFGVESTARDAWERGYEQLFVEDAMSGLSPGAHEFSISTILPRLGVMTTTDEVLKELG
jgi:nicotinamidase-related amidase